MSVLHEIIGDSTYSEMDEYIVLMVTKLAGGYYSRL